MLIVCVLSLWIFSFKWAHAAIDLAFQDDTDLTHFVTRPEIKAPLFDVRKHRPDLISPGYWFIAPYAILAQEPHARNYYQACQTGPAIYDSDGNLVWSGACLVQNQNTMDFRLSEFNGSHYLSAVLFSAWDKARGRGMVLDNSFTMVNTLPASKSSVRFDMHEFCPAEGGTTFLRILHKPEYLDVSSVDKTQSGGWVSSCGFQEIDIVTRAILFEWWTTKHVSPSESSVRITGLNGPPPTAWNFFHMNSVDKSPAGDYMISSRFTDTIYKISGRDGRVLWRLGGTRSSFVMQDFNFSKQHDARFVSENETTTIISLLDNGADDYNQTSSYSSALLIALETAVIPMTARVVQRWIRPDQRLSRLRGNFQLLPNGNAFVGWSDNAYISEHSDDGELLMEARFKSTRFVTYRSYKFPFIGTPSEAPTMKVYAYGERPDAAVQVFYISWNGATDVASWKFYRVDRTSIETPEVDFDDESDLVGIARRTGFETSLHFSGYIERSYAVAMTADNRVIGRSRVELTEVPSHWRPEELTDRIAGQSRSSQESKPNGTSTLNEDSGSMSPLVTDKDEL